MKYKTFVDFIELSPYRERIEVLESKEYAWAGKQVDILQKKCKHIDTSQESAGPSDWEECVDCGKEV